MEIYLAEENSKKKIMQEFEFALNKLNILESFYYLRKNAKIMKLVPFLHSFLLDSGAYTFLSNQRTKTIDWDSYVEEYANFINKYDVKLFFELDIDSIVGIQEVERLRTKLETLTKKKCIPVWHKNRGKEYFIEMCKNYDYVALGGIVIKEIPINTFEQIFNWFISVAHEHNAKIHGLGYTRLTNLKKYKFDSVDSTSWLIGNRAGFLYRFNSLNGEMEIIQNNTNKRMLPQKTATHNFKEWVKYSIYARKNL